MKKTSADLFEIILVNPYSNDYNTVLDEAQRDVWPRMRKRQTLFYQQRKLQK